MTPAETTTDRTPEQWAEFCAREVMGWEQRDGQWWAKGSLDFSVHVRYVCDWSPIDNLADARVVLEKLAQRKCIGEWYIYHQSEGFFGVVLGPMEADSPWAEATGPHEGPAICELAEKILGANHAQNQGSI
jgi:hypothetical protein